LFFSRGFSLYTLIRSFLALKILQGGLNIDATFAAFVAFLIGVKMRALVLKGGLVFQPGE